MLYPFETIESCRKAIEKKKRVYQREQNANHDPQPCILEDQHNNIQKEETRASVLKLELKVVHYPQQRRTTFHQSLFFRAVLCFLNFTDCTSRTAVF
jgi:hypothetical protein